MISRITMAAFALLLIAAPLAAQNQSEVDELRARLRALEAEIESLRVSGRTADTTELERKLDILTREIETLKITRGEPAQADTFQAGLGEAASKIYRSAPGLSFGGYGEMIYEGPSSSRDDGVASGKKDQIDFLRAILYTGYKFNDRVLFNSEIEFEHATTSGAVGEASVEFAYLDFMVRPELNVRTGLLLLPIGLVNELHEPTAFLGANRPAIEGTIIPTTWRENGAGVWGDLGPVTYRAYVVNGLRGERFSAGGLRGGRQKGGKALAEDLAFAARADWAPVEGLMLGGSFYTGGSGQGLTTAAGETIDVQTDIFELHADARIRGWWLRALWADASLSDVAQLNERLGLTGNRSVGEELGGWYGEVGYDLAGVLPLGQASILPFVRYEQLDTQKQVPSGYLRNPASDREILTIGVSWKPIPQTVIKIDHQNIDNEAGTGVDQWNVGVGYIF